MTDAHRGKWTRGPWNLYVDEDRNVIAVTKWGTGDMGGHVAWTLAKMPIPGRRLTQDEINANGRLISRAPELAELLRETLTEATTRTPLMDRISKLLLEIDNA